MNNTIASKTVKIILDQDEQDLIRLAAAIKRLSMSEYCRDLAVTNAREVVKKFNPEFLTQPSDTKPRGRKGTS